MKRMEFAPRMMKFMLKNAGDPCAYGEYGCARAGARRAGSGARFGVNVMNLYPKMMNLYLEMVGFCAENDGFCAGDRGDQGDAGRGMSALLCAIVQLQGGQDIRCSCSWLRVRRLIAIVIANHGH